MHADPRAQRLACRLELRQLDRDVGEEMLRRGGVDATRRGAARAVPRVLQRIENLDRIAQLLQRDAELSNVEDEAAALVAAAAGGAEAARRAAARRSGRGGGVERAAASPDTGGARA